MFMDARLHGHDSKDFMCLWMPDRVGHDSKESMRLMDVHLHGHDSVIWDDKRGGCS